MRRGYEAELLIGILSVFTHLVSPLAIQTPKTWRSERIQPPFPNGPCGGTIVTIPAEDTYGIDTTLNGNKFLLPPRKVDVWLPPDYSSDSRHPILFCHDGDNAMSDSLSWTGASWRLMGALTRLKDHDMLRVPTPLVVLLPSAEGEVIPGVRRRHLEYAGNGMFADAHAEFVVNTLLPLVKNRFSTASDETHAIGSSLGGQASLQLLLRHPGLFNGAACLSPCFDPTTLASVVSNVATLRNKRLYMDIGGDMGDDKVPIFDVWDHLTLEHWWNPGYWWLDSQLQPGVEAIKTTLRMAGVDFMYYEEPGGRHN